jgi:hypothetical protein
MTRSWPAWLLLTSCASGARPWAIGLESERGKCVASGASALVSEGAYEISTGAIVCARSTARSETREQDRADQPDAAAIGQTEGDPSVLRSNALGRGPGADSSR